MFISKMALPRRTFLRGMGATVALPLLDAMVPALSATSRTAAAPVRRLGFVYIPNGAIMDRWTPAAEGKTFELSPILKPLEAHRDRITVVSNLDSRPAEAAEGEGSGDHARASAVWLSGVHPKRTEGADVRGGKTIDQIAADVLGRDTQLRSLEMAAEDFTAVGGCDIGYACSYVNTLSWRAPTTPLPMENDPRVVFERLFGASQSTDPAVWRARREQDRSILDAVRTKANRLRLDLGSSDRAKLDQYLDAIRDLERRISRGEQQAARELPAFDQPAGIPRTFEEHAKLMFDLQVLAYQADLTRVITFMVGHETSQRAYPEIGVSDAHHPLSHHGGNREKIERLTRVNTYHTTMFAYYLQKLRSTADGDGSLLDHLTLIYGSGMSDGNIHNHHDLPTLVVGGGSGTIKGGRHLRYPAKTPVANLFLTLLDKAGIPLDAFGDSTGRLDPLSGV